LHRVALGYAHPGRREGEMVGNDSVNRWPVAIGFIFVMALVPIPRKIATSTTTAWSMRDGDGVGSEKSIERLGQDLVCSLFLGCGFGVRLDLSRFGAIRFNKTVSRKQD
jgi:hypothetical protein